MFLPAITNTELGSFSYLIHEALLLKAFHAETLGLVHRVPASPRLWA
jgi:hypothetical protein